LDDVALVTAADHEVVDPVARVDLHDVPEDRPPADLHHRLRADAALLADARAISAGKDDGLHGYLREWGAVGREAADTVRVADRALRPARARRGRRTPRCPPRCG